MKLFEKDTVITPGGRSYKLQFVREVKDGNLYNFVCTDKKVPEPIIIPNILLESPSEMDIILMMPDVYFQKLLNMYNNKHLMRCYILFNNTATYGVEVDMKELINLEDLLLEEGVEFVCNSEECSHKFSKKGEVYIVNMWMDYLVFTQEDLDKAKKFIKEYNSY